MRILLVDDDADTRLILGQALRQVGGFDITEAASMSEARGLVGTAWFDAIVTDLQLPDGSGDAWLSPALPSGRPVFVITATSGVRSALLAAGARAVFEKPFNPFTIATTVRQLTDSRPAAP